jgi:hypothetical protein
MKTTTPKQEYKERFILLASPIAWSVYFIFVYLLIEAACGIGLLRGAAEALVLIGMLPTLAIIIYAARQGQSVQKQADSAETEAKEEINPSHMQQFAGQVGLWLGVVFVLLTLAVGVTALALQPC